MWPIEVSEPSTTWIKMAISAVSAALVRSGVMWFQDRLRATLWRCQSMVWIAGWLVPHDRRAQWRSEQERKFWHWCHFLAESGQLTLYNRQVIARHCWALFPEAFWLRFEPTKFQSRWRRILGSPLTFLAVLASATLVLVLGSGVISAARAAFSAPVPHPSETVVIVLNGNGINGNFSRTRSDTLLDLASIWGESKAAEGLTPFSWTPGKLRVGSRDLPAAVARVGPQFFSTLDLKPYLGRTFTSDDLHACANCVLLSFPVWRYDFGGDRNIVGKSISVNGTSHTVIGVLPSSFRLISSSIAVWGLIDPAVLFTNFQLRVGAVARLRGKATPRLLERELSDLTESAGYVHPSSQLQVVTVTAQVRHNMVSAIWFVLLAAACAALVVVLRHLSSGLGRLPNGATARVVWLGFLAAKSVLLLAAAASAAWWLVHSLSIWTVGRSNPLMDEYAIWLFLPLAIVALSWSVRDQQQRCRTCLRRLELPVEIGRPGSVLLNWAGTEMVCSEGHGVLYLPDSPANSLDQDRWNKLDESWESLFRAG